MRRSRRSAPYTSSPSTHSHGTPASSARAIIARAIAGLVRNGTSSGTLAARRRSASPAHASGRYSRRSIRACPLRLPYARKTPTWQFLDLPRGAAVLPRHAGRAAALLQEARLADDQDGVRRAEPLDRV